MSKWIKRLTAILLIASMVMSLVSCGFNSSEQVNRAAADSAAESETASQMNSPEEKAEASEQAADAETAEVKTDVDENTTYYEVQFDYSAEEEEQENITLPDTAMVPEGTLLTALQTPEKMGDVFTGWYYDAECTEAATEWDVVDRNMTLYPGFSNQAGMDGDFTINYVCDTDVDETYPIELVAYGLAEEEILELLAARNMTLGGEDFEIAISEIIDEAEIEPLDLDALELSEEDRELLDFAISEKEKDSEVSLFEGLKLLDLDEDIITRILTEYAPDELEEHYVDIELADFSEDAREYLESKGIDFNTVTEAELREFYVLEEDESLQTYLEEELLYTTEDIIALTDLLVKNEEKLAESGVHYYVSASAGKWTAGNLHQIELLDTERLHFVFHEEETDESVVYYNFSVYHPQVFNLTVNNGVVYIPVSDVTGVEITEGLYSVVVDEDTAEGSERNDSGVMTYGGSLKVGDTVAIYNGTLLEGGQVDGEVGYYTITEAPGNGTYAYTGASYEEVVFIPDVIPIPDDGSYEDNQITVPAAGLDFSAEVYRNVGLDADTEMGAGDFIAFYTGELSQAETIVSAGYGRITDIMWDDAYAYITYEPVGQSEVLGSSEMYMDYDDMPIDITDEEAVALEAEMRLQAEESGFFEKSGEYIGAMLTDEEFDLNDYEHADELKRMTFAAEDGTLLSLEELKEMAGSGASRVEVSDPVVTFKITPKLEHFDGVGMRGELSASFKVTINLNKVGDVQNKIEITCMTALEQEIVLGLHVSGKIQWKWYACFPYPNEVNVSASFRAGTYTGFGVVCTVQTTSENEKLKALAEANKDKNKPDPKKMSGKIKILVESAKKVAKGASVSNAGDDDQNEFTGADGGLQEKYSEMLKNDAKYINIVDKEIFRVEASPDPLHLICFSLGANFVFSIKINAMIGVGLTYANAKQYSYNFKVFKGTIESSEADLETPNFRADFYAFGMIGIRAGIKLDIRVGLVSTKTNSIGVTVEAGVYAELYGFLYVYYTWQSGEGSDWGAEGSLLFEIGIYLEINFKAQLGEGKVNKSKKLFSKKWPLLQLGAVAVPDDFTIKKDSEKLSVNIPEGKNKVTIDKEVLSMSMMALSTGTLSDVDKDSNAIGEQNYTFTINDKTYTQYNEENFIVNCYDLDGENGSVVAGQHSFTYLPATNEIYVKPADSSVEELWGIVTFTYKNNTFGFDTRSLSRTVKVHWKGSAAFAEVRYYMETGAGTGEYRLAGTGEFDGFNGIEYDLIITEDLIYQYDGYRLTNAVFMEDAEYRAKVEAAKASYETVLSKYQRYGGEEFEKQVLKESTSFQELYTRYNKYLRSIGECIKNQSGTMSFMMVANETVVELYFDVAEHYATYYILSSKDDDKALDIAINRGRKNGMLDITVTGNVYKMPARDITIKTYLVGRSYRINWNLDNTYYDHEMASAGEPILDFIPSEFASYEKEGYHIVWAVSIDGTLTDIDDTVTMPEREITVYGRYVRNDCVIRWMNGDQLLLEETVPYESRLKFPPVEVEGLGELVWMTEDGKLAEEDSPVIGNMTLFANKHEHEWGEETVIKEGTCVSGREYIHTCTICGMERQEIAEIDPDDHVFELVRSVSATCSKEGEDYYECAYCDETKTEYSELNPEQHSSTMVMGEKVPATCAEDGHEADWLCKDCGAVVVAGAVIPATGDHKYDTYVGVGTPSTCKEYGTDIWKCSVCGAETEIQTTALDPENHAGETELKKAAAATCGKSGYTGDTVCTDCGATIVKGTVIPATGQHSYGAPKVIKKATCKGTGVQQFTCSECGATANETLPIDPENHAGGTTTVDAKKATCTEEGYTGDTKCKGCDAVLAYGSVIPAEGDAHTWDSGVTEEAHLVLKENDGADGGDAEFFAPGVKYTCTSCGEVRRETEKADIQLRCSDGSSAYFCWTDLLADAVYFEAETLGDVLIDYMDAYIEYYQIEPVISVGYEISEEEGGKKRTTSRDIVITADISISSESAAITFEELKKIYEEDSNALVAITLHVKPVVSQTSNSKDYFGKYSGIDLYYNVYGDVNDIAETDVVIYIQGHEHIWSEPVVDIQHTETEDGRYKYSCTVEGCNEVYYKTMPAGHSFDDTVSTTYCVQDDAGTFTGMDGQHYTLYYGVEKGTCTVCGGEIETPDTLIVDLTRTYIEAFMHDMLSAGNVILSDIGFDDFENTAYIRVPCGAYDSGVDECLILEGTSKFIEGHTMTDYSSVVAADDIAELRTSKAAYQYSLWYEFVPNAKYSALNLHCEYRGRFEVILRNELMEQWHDFHISSYYPYSGDKQSVVPSDPAFENGHWVCGKIYSTCLICGKEEEESDRLEPYLYNTGSGEKTRTIDGKTYPAVNATSFISDWNYLKSLSIIDPGTVMVAYYTASGLYDENDPTFELIEGTCKVTGEYLRSHEDTTLNNMEDGDAIIVSIYFWPDDETNYKVTTYDIVIYMQR